MVLKKTVQIQSLSLDDIEDLEGFYASSTFDLEQMILSITSIDELEIMILKFIGYDYKEIIDILNYKTMGEYYGHLKNLKNTIKKIMDDSL